MENSPENFKRQYRFRSNTTAERRIFTITIIATLVIVVLLMIFK